MRGRRTRVTTLLSAFGWLALLVGCNNNPLPSNAAGSNTLFSAVIESSPRHLDPTASYWSNDTPYTYQIYEPLYGYHYLKRPFVLVPKTAQEVVKPEYFDKGGKPLPDGRARRTGRRERVQRAHQARHPVPAAPGVHARRRRQVPLPRDEARRTGRPAHAASTSPTPTRANSSPRTSSTRSSATRRRASRRQSFRSLPSTCSA